jgi:hypothetical protein
MTARGGRAPRSHARHRIARQRLDSLRQLTTPRSTRARRCRSLFSRSGLSSSNSSIAWRNASNPSARCAEPTAMKTLVSPTFRRPTRWAIAARTPGQRSSTSRSILSSSRSAWNRTRNTRALRPGGPRSSRAPCRRTSAPRPRRVEPPSSCKGRAGCVGGQPRHSGYPRSPAEAREHGTWAQAMILPTNSSLTEKTCTPRAPPRVEGTPHAASQQLPGRRFLGQRNARA